MASNIQRRYNKAKFSTETMQTTREWQEILQVIKRTGLQPRLYCQARLSFKIESETSSFPDKRRLKQYISSKPAMQDMIEGLH